VGVVEHLIKQLLHYTSLLDKLSTEDLKDEYRYYAALHLLQIQSQILIDIAIRAASALGLEVEGYIDAGYKLNTINIINNNELKLYRKVVGFRNIVVHGYSTINPEIIKEIIQEKRYRDVAKLALKIFEELHRKGIDC